MAIWGGIHSLTTGDPLNNGTFATSDDSGAAWTVDPAGPWPSGGTAGGSYVYAAQIGAGNGSDGTPYETWSHSGVFVHRGLDPSTPVSDFNAPIGGETTGDSGRRARRRQRGAVARLAEQSEGARRLCATGRPGDRRAGGSPALMPGSVTSFQGADESSSILGRTPITGRSGQAGRVDGVHERLSERDQGARLEGGRRKLDHPRRHEASNVRRVAIAADPDGRIIVAWGEDTGGAGKLFVRVSTPMSSSWGPAFEIDPPGSFQSGWALQASAQSGALRRPCSQNFTEADGKTMRFWHTQALAPPVLAKAVNARIVQGTRPGASCRARTRSCR